MKRALFLPLYESNIHLFLPLIRQMQAQKVLEPLVILLERVHTDRSARFLNEQQVPYMKLDIFPRPFKRGARVDISELPMRIMERHMTTLFHTRRKVKDLFNSLDPALIVTVNETFYAERFFLQEAKQRGTPSLSLLFVTPAVITTTSPLKTGNTARLHKILPFLRQLLQSNMLSLYRYILIYLGIPLYYIGAPTKGEATNVCVLSEIIKQEMVKSGSIAGKIEATGSPGHDMIFWRDSYFGQKTTNRIHETFNIDRDKEIILFTSQPLAKYGACSPEEQRRLTELLIETCAKFDKYILVIKLHPTESRRDYAYVNRGTSHQTVRLVTDEDAYLYDLIYASKMVITQSSTTGLDAVLFDKEVININIIFKVQPDYVKEGTTINVYSEAELTNALHQALNDKAIQAKLKKARKRFIEKHIPTFDGRSTDRVMALINQTLAERIN